MDNKPLKDLSISEILLSRKLLNVRRAFVIISILASTVMFLSSFAMTKDIIKRQYCKVYMCVKGRCVCLK